MKPDTFQLIIIGAGISGCSIAMEAAKNDLSVVLIDKQKKENIGEKNTCDTIPSYVFDELSLPLPAEDEIRNVMKSMKVFSPNMRYHFETAIGAYLVHRSKFYQRLLNDGLARGVCLHTETEYKEPVIEKGFIIGVRCRTSGGKNKEYRGQIICDASGYTGIVRNSLPDSVYHYEALNRHDTAWGYKEVRDIIDSSETIPDGNFPGWYCYIKNRGYAWIIPECNGKGNIGCWVPLSSGDLDPEKLTKEYCDSVPEYIGKKTYDTGIGPEPYVPLRTCQPELVGNGFMVVGDAAYQSSPVSAFGMPGSMIAGKCAAEVAVSAIKKRDVSRKGLWEYNVRYKQGRGAAQAFLHPIRIFLQNTTDHDMNILIKTGLLGSMEFSLLWTNHTFTYTVVDHIKKFFIGFPHFRLLLKLRFIYSLCKKMETHYRQFPKNIKMFKIWSSKRKKLYQKLFNRLKVKREL